MILKRRYKMKDAIVKLIESNYKKSRVWKIDLSGDYLTLNCTTNRGGLHPYIALRILNKYPEIRTVHFTGGWVEGVYTRETLRWSGYKVK